MRRIPENLAHVKVSLRNITARIRRKTRESRSMALTAVASPPIFSAINPQSQESPPKIPVRTIKRSVFGSAEESVSHFPSIKAAPPIKTAMDIPRIAVARVASIPAIPTLESIPTTAAESAASKA